MNLLVSFERDNKVSDRKALFDENFFVIKDFKSIIKDNCDFKIIDFSKTLNGIANKVFKIKTNKGNFFLKYYRKDINPKNSIEFSKWCRNNGICAVVPEYIHTDETNNIITLSRECEGNHLVNINKRNIEELINIFVRFQKINKTNVFPIGETDLIKKADNFFSYLTDHNTRIDKVIINDILQLYTTLRKDFKENESKKSIVHGDLSPSNILWKDGKITGILDFDETIIGFDLYDLAVMAIKFSTKSGNTDLRTLNAFFKSYRDCSDLKYNDKYFENCLNFYILKVIMEKLSLYEMGIIDTNDAHQKKDSWENWYQLLKERKIKNK